MEENPLRIVLYSETLPLSFGPNLWAIPMGNQKTGLLGEGLIGFKYRVREGCVLLKNHVKTMVACHLIIGGLMLQGCAQKSITLIADPEVVVIPIVENDEPLIDLKTQTLIAYGPSPEIPNNTDYTKMRRTIYEKLVQAQMLLPKGLRLCLYEGYRSLSLQQMLFDNRSSKVSALHPTWSEDQVFNETTKLVSPVWNKDGSKNTPPHSTGAAVDVYLIDEKNQPVDMGLQIKDWMGDDDGSLSQTDSQQISPEAQGYRDIMNTALLTVGFINYPTEYWHWSYGDRYWAHQTGHAHAIYGSLEGGAP